MDDKELRVMRLPLKLWARIITLVYAVVFVVVWFRGGNVPSPIWWLGTALIALVEGTAEFVIPKYKEAQRTRQADLLASLDELQKESPNFEQIRNAQKTDHTFSGLHKKAVEVHAFNKAKRALERLLPYWRYRKLARLGLKEIERNYGRQLQDMDVEQLLKTIATLIQSLNAELKKRVTP